MSSSCICVDSTSPATATSRPGGAPVAPGRGQGRKTDSNARARRTTRRRTTLNVTDRIPLGASPSSLSQALDELLDTTSNSREGRTEVRALEHGISDLLAVDQICLFALLSRQGVEVVHPHPQKDLTRFETGDEIVDVGRTEGANDGKVDATR